MMDPNPKSIFVRRTDAQRMLGLGKDAMLALQESGALTVVHTKDLAAFVAGKLGKKLPKSRLPSGPKAATCRDTSRRGVCLYLRSEIERIMGTSK